MSPCLALPQLGAPSTRSFVSLRNGALSHALSGITLGLSGVVSPGSTLLGFAAQGIAWHCLALHQLRAASPCSA